MPRERLLECNFRPVPAPNDCYDLANMAVSNKQVSTLALSGAALLLVGIFSSQWWTIARPQRFGLDGELRLGLRGARGCYDHAGCLDLGTLDNLGLTTGDSLFFSLAPLTFWVGLLTIGLFAWFLLDRQSRKLTATATASAAATLLLAALTVASFPSSLAQLFEYSWAHGATSVGGAMALLAGVYALQQPPTESGSPPPDPVDLPKAVATKRRDD